MGDLYTRCEICIISVVLLITMWEVPLPSNQPTMQESYRYSNIALQDIASQQIAGNS